MSSDDTFDLFHESFLEKIIDVHWPAGLLVVSVETDSDTQPPLDGLRVKGTKDGGVLQVNPLTVVAFQTGIEKVPIVDPLNSKMTSAYAFWTRNKTTLATPGHSSNTLFVNLSKFDRLPAPVTGTADAKKQLFQIVLPALDSVNTRNLERFRVIVGTDIGFFGDGETGAGYISYAAAQQAAVDLGISLTQSGHPPIGPVGAAAWKAYGWYDRDGNKIGGVFSPSQAAADALIKQSIFDAYAAGPEHSYLTDEVTPSLTVAVTTSTYKTSKRKNYPFIDKDTFMPAWDLNTAISKTNYTLFNSSGPAAAVTIGIEVEQPSLKVKLINPP